MVTAPFRAHSGITIAPAIANINNRNAPLPMPGSSPIIDVDDSTARKSR
jgi:hypothetical protein